LRNLKALREEVRNHIDVRFKELRDQALIYFEKADKADKTHALYMAEITGINPSTQKPLTVRKGDNEAQAYSSPRIVELYQAGKLNLGDHVLITFIDGDQDKPVVLDRLFIPTP
jgi:hypothetical protein